jgi:hypothetical protein
LENVKEIELNASERCARGNENPRLEGSTRSRNITDISDSELEERKDCRIPANTRMGTTCMGNRSMERLGGRAEQESNNCTQYRRDSKWRSFGKYERTTKQMVR